MKKSREICSSFTEAIEVKEEGGDGGIPQDPSRGGSAGDFSSLSCGILRRRGLHTPLGTGLEWWALGGNSKSA